jgi:hypothetical protein
VNRLHWLAVAIGLAGVFCLSIAAGAYVGRLRATPSNPPVAVASPTPDATTSAPPTTAATASPSLAPTVAPTAPPTQAPPSATPSAAPTTALDPATAEQFALDLSAAIRSGHTDYLLARLHPAVIERYGTRICRSYINGTVAGDDVRWTVSSTTGPAAWSYETDGLTTPIAEAWMVSVNQAGATPEARDLHFAPSDGTWRWFTDCGTPQ